MTADTPNRPDRPDPPDLLDRLDDLDYPAYTTGQAAEVLGVQQAFLRALDSAGALSPGRSGGGHRRYSRRQLAFAQRIRAEFDQGHTLAATLQILALQDELAAAQALIASLRRQLRDRDQRPEPPQPPASGGQDD
jgi:MerR family transcriptional regulator, heat shock protein HspR